MRAAAATRGELHLGATAFQPWRALLRAMDGARCGSDAAMRQTNAVTGAIGTQRRRRECSKLCLRGRVGFCRVASLQEGFAKGLTKVRTNGSLAMGWRAYGEEVFSLMH